MYLAVQALLFLITSRLVLSTVSNVSLGALHQPCGQIVFFSTAAPNESFYRPQGDDSCIDIQAVPVGSDYTRGLLRSIRICSDPATQLNCQIKSLDIAEGGSLTFSAPGVGVVKRVDGRGYFPSPILSPRSELLLTFDGGKEAGLGAQIHCTFPPSPCGQCSGGTIWMDPLGPESRSPFRLVSPGQARMPPECLCDYRLRAKPGYVIRLAVQSLVLPNGTDFAVYGECGGALSPSNATAVEDRAMKVLFRSPQTAQAAASFVLEVSVAKEPSSLVCPTAASPTTRSPVTHTSSPHTSRTVSLSTGAIVGIALAGLVFLVVATGVSALVGFKFGRKDWPKQGPQNVALPVRPPIDVAPPGPATDNTTPEGCQDSGTIRDMEEAAVAQGAGGVGTIGSAYVAGREEESIQEPSAIIRPSVGDSSGIGSNSDLLPRSQRSASEQDLNGTEEARF